jgi:hypothetical protein
MSFTASRTVHSAKQNQGGRADARVSGEGARGKAENEAKLRRRNLLNSKQNGSQCETESRVGDGKRI